MDDGLQNGDSLKNHLFDGMDVDPNFLKAYGKQLDEYADNIQKAGKNAKTSEIDINGFNESLVRSGQEAVKTTTFMQDIGNGLKSCVLPMLMQFPTLTVYLIYCIWLMFRKGWELKRVRNL